MSDFERLLAITGSATRLRLLELLARRARGISELARHVGVTQQAVMKHLAILQRSGLVQQTKLDSKSKVKTVYEISKPLSFGYSFKNGVLTLHIGSADYKADISADMRQLKALTYSRKLLNIRTKVMANRLRTLVEQDLRMQAKIAKGIKDLDLSATQRIALRCILSPEPETNLEEASRTFGCDLGEAMKRFK